MKRSILITSAGIQKERFGDATLYTTARKALTGAILHKAGKGLSKIADHF